MVCNNFKSNQWILFLYGYKTKTLNIGLVRNAVIVNIKIYNHSYEIN